MAITNTNGFTWANGNTVMPSRLNQMQAQLKLNAAANVLLGRTGTSGAVEEIPCTAAGRALLAGADAAAQRTTLGVGSMATRAVTISTSDPSGGADGDVWLKYTP